MVVSRRIGRRQEPRPAPRPFLQTPNRTPLGDLYVTMLQRYDIPIRSFAENAGEFSELVS
jgi:hypothetical protein